MARGSLALGTAGSQKVPSLLPKPSGIKASKVGVEPEIEREVVNLLFGGSSGGQSDVKKLQVEGEALASEKQALVDSCNSSPRVPEPSLRPVEPTSRLAEPSPGGTSRHVDRQQMDDEATNKSHKNGYQEGFEFVEVTTSTQLMVDFESDSKPGKGKRQYSSPVSSGTFLPTAEGKVPGHLRAIQFGLKGSLKYRMVFVKGRRETSPWHIIPLYGPDCLLNCICTTPAGSWLRLEVAQSEPFNPLKLVKKKGKPARFSENAPWNVGILPQTWADPDQPADSAVTSVGIRGGSSGKGGSVSKGSRSGTTFCNNGCPLEVVEVGDPGIKRRLGEVYLVKPLGTFAVVEGQTVSWKIIAVDEADPRAEELQDIKDLERFMPGKVEEIKEWLRTCLCTDPGDAERGVALNGQAGGLEVAARTLAEAHAAWQLYTHQMEPHVSVLANVGLSASTLERHWASFTANESDTSLPLSGASGAQATYDKAWASLAETSSEKAPETGGLESPGHSKYLLLRNGLTKHGAKKTDHKKNKYHQPLMQSLICGSDQFADLDVIEEEVTPSRDPRANEKTPEGSGPSPSLWKQPGELSNPGATASPDSREVGNRATKSPSFFSPSLSNRSPARSSSPARSMSPARLSPPTKTVPLGAQPAGGFSGKEVPQELKRRGSHGKEMEGFMTSFDELGGAHGVWMPQEESLSPQDLRSLSQDLDGDQQGASKQSPRPADEDMYSEMKRGSPRVGEVEGRVLGEEQVRDSSQRDSAKCRNVAEGREDAETNGGARGGATAKLVAGTPGNQMKGVEEQLEHEGKPLSSAAVGPARKGHKTVQAQEKENLYDDSFSFPKESHDDFDDPDDIPVAMVADDYAVMNILEGNAVPGAAGKLARSEEDDLDSSLSPATRRAARPPRGPSSALRGRGRRNSFEGDSPRDSPTRRRVSFCPVVEVVTFSSENPA